jgi:hypothetical protein
MAASGIVPKPIEIELNAAIVAVEGDTPLILVVRHKGDGERDSLGLPFGPFDPLAHRTLEMGLRAWVEEQTALRLGYVEQLYTFGDRGRHTLPGDVGPHVMSVGYLALTRVTPEANTALERAGAEWRDWYEFFPWEDWRAGRPPIVDDVVLPALRRFVRSPPPGPQRSGPNLAERMHMAFGDDNGGWDEERVLERYELLYSAALVSEARRDGRVSAHGGAAIPGMAMRFDHRRILATAISRLRGKLKYRPLVFELMPEEFTLTELQRTVEAISGRHLHKQNFRRLVEAGALVEPTGASTARTGGRPAALFQFRRDVIRERAAPGLKLGVRS